MAIISVKIVLIDTGCNCLGLFHFSFFLEEMKCLLVVCVLLLGYSYTAAFTLSPIGRFSLKSTTNSVAKSFLGSKSALGAHTIDSITIDGPLSPLGSHVLVKVKEAEEKSAGGIIIPDNAKEKPTVGTVVAIGPGEVNGVSGRHMPVSVKVGDNILYSKYSGTQINYDGKQHHMIRDEDILFMYTGEKIDMTKVSCLHDNVVVKLAKGEEKSASGIYLTTQQKKVDYGEVVSVGPGAITPHGVQLPMPLVVGDKVKIRDYCGTDMTVDGQAYVVLKVIEILAKMN